MRRLVSALCLVAALLPAAAQSKRQAATGLGKYFGAYTACMVLYDVQSKQYTRVNPERCGQRFSPCSTFKIYNALVALDTGVLQDENTLFEWDGTERAIPAWNMDHTLASAMANSVVWYFQKVAREIGPERMERYLNDVQPYGNRDISGGIDTFWLRSTMTISAEEQVDFLQKLYLGGLKFKPESIATVKKVLVLSDAKDTVFSGKTGSADGFGWFVGHVKGPKGEYVFAFNIEGQGASGRAAKEIAITLLRERKMMP